MKNVNIEHMGENFDARNVAKKTMDHFVASYKGRLFKKLNEEQQILNLREVHKKCTQAVSEADAELTTETEVVTANTEENKKNNKDKK